jgi:Protein kinase domain
MFELDDSAAEGLRRDWKRCAALEHPNVTGALELFEHEGTLVAAFEGVRGVSLLDALSYLDERDEHLSDGAALKIGLAVARALLAAHTAKDDTGKVSPLVHGELGPHQVFLTFDGSVRLLGLGLGTAFRTAAARHELPEAARPFAAPETRQGGTLTVRANVYSLAAILWRLLSRRPLPDGPPPSLRTLRPDLSAAVAAIVDRALEPSMIKRTAACFQIAQTIQGTGLADAKDLKWNLALLAETDEYAGATISPLSFPPQALSDVPPDSVQPVSELPPDGDWSDFPTGTFVVAAKAAPDPSPDDLDWGLDTESLGSDDVEPKDEPKDEPKAEPKEHDTVPKFAKIEPAEEEAVKRKRWKAPLRRRRPPAKTQRLLAMSPERAQAISRAQSADAVPTATVTALDERSEASSDAALGDHGLENQPPPSSKRPKREPRAVEPVEPDAPMAPQRDQGTLEARRSYVDIPPMPVETPAMAATRTRIESARKQALSAMLADDDEDQEDGVDSEDPTRQRWVFAPRPVDPTSRRGPQAAAASSPPTGTASPPVSSPPVIVASQPPAVTASPPATSQAPPDTGARPTISPGFWLLSLGVVGALCAAFFAAGLMLGARNAASAPQPPSSSADASSHKTTAPPATASPPAAVAASASATLTPAMAPSASGDPDGGDPDTDEPDRAAALLNWQAHLFVTTDQAGAHVYVAGRPAGLPNTLLTMSCGVKSVRLGNFPLTEWLSPSSAFKLPCQKRTDLVLGPSRAELKR